MAHGMELTPRVKVSQGRSWSGTGGGVGEKMTSKASCCAQHGLVQLGYIFLGGRGAVSPPPPNSVWGSAPEAFEKKTAFSFTIQAYDDIFLAL